jgi:hypothetical protein
MQLILQLNWIEYPLACSIWIYDIQYLKILKDDASDQQRGRELIAIYIIFSALVVCIGTMWWWPHPSELGAFFFFQTQHPKQYFLDNLFEARYIRMHHLFFIRFSWVSRVYCHVPDPITTSTRNAQCLYNVFAPCFCSFSCLSWLGRIHGYKKLRHLLYCLSFAWNKFNIYWSLKPSFVPAFKNVELLAISFVA